MARLVTLVNRSSKTLEGTWDGRHYELTPGRHQFSEAMAQKFKAQHPIMGTEDLRTLEQQYLLGIVEEGDDISPVEQSDALERWRRTPEEQARVEVVPGKNGIFSARDVATALPQATNFSKA